MAARNFTRICLILSLLTSLVNGIHDIRHQRLRPRSLTDEVSNAPEALITDVPRIGSGSPIEQQSTEQIKLFRRENEDLKSKLEEMLDVRLALIHALYGSEPKIARRQTTTPLDLSKENQELQQGLDSLNSAFASLYNILAKQLPVCLENDKGGSSENTAGSNNQGLSTIYQVTVYSTTGTTVSRTIRSTVLVIPPTPSSQPAVSPSRTSPTYSNGTSTRTKGISSSATDLVAPIPSSVPATSTGASADMNPGTNPDTSPGTAPGTNPGLSSGDSTFDPDSTSNVAVYYGQSNITSSIRLDSLCADPSIDIVILAFVTSFDTGNGYPALDLSGSGCWSASSSQQIAGAEGLLDCTVNVAPQIQTCQNLGKKVLLSIGGYTGRAVIPDEQSASTYAETLWDLFGEGTGLEELRPFGNASVDGFDIDNEDGTTAHWATFLSALRTEMTSATKPMFLTAAPQCPRPDASIPLTSMQSTLDFIFVQFYNNDGCDLRAGQAFLDSVLSWSSDLTQPTAGGGSFVNIGNGVSSPRLYIGAPSFEEAGPHAYTDPSDFGPLIQSVRELGLENLGGGMLWNGEWGLENKDESGTSFVTEFKRAFEG